MRLRIIPMDLCLMGALATRRHAPASTTRSSSRISNALVDSSKFCQTMSTVQRRPRGPVRPQEAYIPAHCILVVVRVLLHLHTAGPLVSVRRADPRYPLALISLQASDRPAQYRERLRSHRLPHIDPLCVRIHPVHSTILNSNLLGRRTDCRHHSHRQQQHLRQRPRRPATAPEHQCLRQPF